MYKINYTVKEEDINYGGHVGNERALLFFQYARINFFKSLGISEKDIGEGIGLIQKNSFVEYNKQLFLGDTITITITDITLSRSSFKIEYEIYTEDGIKAINGSTLIVCYNYSENRVKKMPEPFKEKVLSVYPGDNR